MALPLESEPVEDFNPPVAGEQAKTGDLFDSIFGMSPEKKLGPVAQMGQVASMVLPEGWVEGVSARHGPAVAKEFHPLLTDETGNIEDNNEVQINIAYRGFRASDAATTAFRELLDRGPHEIPHDQLQNSPLSEVLHERGHKNTFTVTAARIENINGMPALVVEGDYTNHPVRARVAYIDADRRAVDRSNGAPIQEITYMATRENFPKFSESARKAINSIVWKS